MEQEEGSAVATAESGKQGGPRVGRRARAAGRRPAAVLVRLTDQEREWLRSMATAAGCSVPRLLIESAAAQDAGDAIATRTELMRELTATRRLLANIANNINQVAAATNSGGDVPAGVYDAELAQLRTVAGRLGSAMDVLTR